MLHSAVRPDPSAQVLCVAGRATWAMQRVPRQLPLVEQCLVPAAHYDTMSVRLVGACEAYR